MNNAIFTFIEEEVTRQGFKVGTPEWHTRCQWMGEAWEWAQRRAANPPRPGVKDVLKLGKLVEHQMNAGGFRKVGVRVGGRVCPLATNVPQLMDAWSILIHNIVPDHAYLIFELIHPFGDGNGRVGKILHNWLSGTLLAPILVQDYFGGGVP